MTLGPPALRFNRPETASMASRISSAVSRRRLNRQRRRFSGSIPWAFAAIGDRPDCR